ncbi:SufE family protein [Martelella mediterranea]|uniref:Cysteine desulfuration protein SufE n=1 Tax=Martelella mediterranea TaxID=293089 RepID=A0A4R3NT04_9HYPH|nr:SufE family protein [Martelella mediterranea]TCT35489.1 cysteine desulfuration protein SufE [Martelella mediterranea]
MPQTIDQIIDDFAFLDDWEDRYRYVIELGKTLPDLPAEEKTEANRVHGCASQVWLVAEAEEGQDPPIRFRGDSDAFIVRGLVSIVMTVYSGKTASEIAKTDAIDTFRKIGLVDHLSAQRANGLNAMVTRIREIATQRLSHNA